MDQGQGPAWMSVVVEMEEEDLTNHRNLPNIITTREMNKQYLTKNGANQNGMKSESFVVSQQRQLKPHTSSNYRKLDTAERRQLRAQLRATGSAKAIPDRAFRKSVTAPDYLRTQETVLLQSVEPAENSESLYPYDNDIAFMGEGVRPDITPTTRDNLENNVSKNWAKMNSMMCTLRPSYGSRPVEEADICDSFGHSTQSPTNARPMSVIVEMEEEDFDNSPSHPHTVMAMERDKQHLTTNREHKNGMRSNLFTASPSKQIKPEKSTNYLELNTAERRRLQAEPMGIRAADADVQCGTRESVIALENLGSREPSPLIRVEDAENCHGSYEHESFIRILGEGVIQDVTRMSNIDSENEISKNGDLMIRTLPSSYGSNGTEKKRCKTSGDGTDETASTDCEESDPIAVLCAKFEKAWEENVAITEEEVRNGYRFTEKVDAGYLGFRPRETDKRKYLKAYPIVGPVPQAKLGSNCSLPMTCCQWGFVIGSLIMLATLVTGAYFIFFNRETLH